MSARCTGSATRSSTAGRRRSSSRSTRTRAWRRRTRRARRTCRSASCAATAAPTSPRSTRVDRDVTCPFTGEELAAVPALRPDVGVIHAQQADAAGNVQLWGITGVQKETVLASQRAIVTVEEIVPTSSSRGRAASSSRRGRSTRSCVAPGGAHPSYAHGYYDRDNAFYRRVGRDQPRPRRVPGLDAAPRARDSRRRRVPRVACRSPREHDADVHRRRDDGRRGRAGSCATGWSASWASACPPGGEPGEADAAPRAACSSTRAARSAPSRRGSRSRSATASSPTPPTRSSPCPRSSPTGSRPAASTSASSARRRSTGMRT